MFPHWSILYNKHNYLNKLTKSWFTDFNKENKLRKTRLLVMEPHCVSSVVQGPIPNVKAQFSHSGLLLWKLRFMICYYYTGKTTRPDALAYFELVKSGSTWAVCILPEVVFLYLQRRIIILQVFFFLWHCAVFSPLQSLRILVNFCSFLTKLLSNSWNISTLDVNNILLQCK